MWRSRICALLLGVLVAAAAARACMFATPWQLLDNRRETLIEAPVNSFAWEVRHWVAPSRWVTHPADNPVYPETSDTVREAAEKVGLGPAQQAALAAMRAARNSRTAIAAAGDLPAAIRFYTAGAVAFRTDDLDSAAYFFNLVLHLPQEQAASRAVWAQYMLGRIAINQQSPAKAEAAFAATRELAARGEPDPLGLAIASLGESARLHLDAGDVPGAVRLYAEQAADGSDEAVDSLHMVAADAMAHPERLPGLVADPATQRLLVAYALALTGDYLHELHTAGSNAFRAGFAGFYPPDDADLGPLGALLHLIRTSNVVVAQADRLAALAYRLGDYQSAAAIAARSRSPMALWIEAKIALQNWDNRTAARLFAAALGAAAKPGAAASMEPSSVRLLRGETAVIGLGRGDFVQAAGVLWPVAGIYWGDFAYLAERVLTDNELKAFVDAHAPAPQPAAGSEFNVVNKTRGLLARRLMRDRRYQDALPYFDHVPADARDFRADALALAAGLDRWRGAFWATDRAKGAWEAAVILRSVGMELTGTETSPDQSALDGEFESGYGPVGAPADLNAETVSALQDERVRYDASRPRPDLRFHYRYIAVEQALAAADELPPRSQAFAAVLCQASGWMMSTHADEKARAIYLRYVSAGAVVPFATHFGHSCPEPDFTAVSSTRWRLLAIEGRNLLHRWKWAGLTGSVLLLLAAGSGIVWARRQN